MANYGTPQHLTIGVDGDLYDTRTPGYYGRPALRTGFRRHHRAIQCLADVKATLRAGEFTFPGGYRMAFLTHCGAVLSFAAVRGNWDEVVWDFINDASTGWMIDASFHIESGEEVYCDRTGEALH